MKNYLAIMEEALSAYSDKQIRDYINEVKRDGLTEHGFPRLGANMGILIANGIRTDLTDVFIEIMDICCSEMPLKKAANNFSIREVCCCLMLLEDKGVIDASLISKWKSQLASFDPWTKYNCIAPSPDTMKKNWAMFSSVSDFVRGKYCGIDTSEFVDWHISSQLFNFDSLDMYCDNGKDPDRNPVVYDLTPRLLIAFLLRFGYNGKHRKRLESILDNTADVTLKMQSVTGELAFGGRSNQFLHNEAMLYSYCELEALRFWEKGDAERAGEFKAAAGLAAENLLKWLNMKPTSHIKNRYDVSAKTGCEGYGYFNKYMITVASNIFVGAMFADDTIECGTLKNKENAYVLSTTDRFNKVFVNAGGYFLEFDTNADLHYDANGLGRVHKKNCDPRVCLSVPFPCSEPNYKTEMPNAHPLSICCFKDTDGGIICSAQEGMLHDLTSKTESGRRCSVTFECNLNEERLFTEKYTVSDSGVDIEFCGADGMLIPVFLFDGANETEITASNGQIAVKYNGSFCRYSFSGEPEEYGVFYNRNGRYRAYRVNAGKLHIEMGDVNEF